MGKINIALTSGSQLEKPLISAFNGTGGAYVVLDNEMNGTMGLPIILVAKYSNNRLEKIADQNEWNSVKECLRNIISGNQMNYITVPSQLSADDGFFSQLTLPVASFESLKANYKPIEGDTSGGAMPNAMPEAPATPVALADPMGGMPEVPVGPAPVSPAPVAPAASEIPVMPSAVPNSDPVVNVGPQPVPNAMSTPEVSVTPVAQPAPMPEPVAPVMPTAPTGQTMDAFAPVGPTPAVEPIPTAAPSTPVDFSADKAAFLKACENMFDALVAKFNK